MRWMFFNSIAIWVTGSDTAVQMLLELEANLLDQNVNELEFDNELSSMYR